VAELLAWIARPQLPGVYKQWTKSTEAKRLMHRLSDAELAVLIFEHTPGARPGRL